MRTSRRQFLEISSAVGAMLPISALTSKAAGANEIERLPAFAQQESRSSSAPLWKFSGTDLKGWTPRGSAMWSANNGEIVAAKGEGWLVLDQGLQDFAMKFAFQANGADVSVVLRNAPVGWSRFAHPADSGSKTAGIYVELTGKNAGAMFLVTFDADGKEVDRKLVPPPPLDIAGEVHEMAAGACAPIACAGINSPRGALKGYPPEPPVRIEKGADGWQIAEISLRGDAFPWDESGVGKIANQRSQFGKTGLQVRASGDGSARFKDITVFDLTERVAGLASNVGDSKYRQLTDLFYSEAIAAGDLNHDGHDEIIAGPFYYVGPDFKIAREIFPPTTVNVGGRGEGGNYSNTFLIHAHDFRGDGWSDIIMILGFGPMPSFAAYLFVNPRGERRHWDNHVIVPSVSAETTVLADVDGDGHPELVLSVDDRIGYAKPDLTDLTKPWTFVPVSEKGSWGPHGFGVGDVNGDGRPEILQASGYWEPPAAGAKGLWKFHPVPFGATEGEWFLRGGGDIIVHDVNGDGVPDVIASLNAHGPGLAWFEQSKDAQGNSTWKRHLIMGSPATPLAERKDWEETDKEVAFTELHALALADLDGDGVPSIITGKRWWSHGYIYEENQVDNPPVLYRFKLDRKSKDQVRWVPRQIHNCSGIGTQILAQDINKDGKIEILTSARKGAFCFFDTRGKS